MTWQVCRSGSLEEAEICVVHQANASLGEGPIWDTRLEALYWVDIHRRRIHRYRISEARQDGVWITRKSPGCLGLTESTDVVVVASGADVLLVDLRSGAETPVATLPIDTPLMRANDGRVDAAGRLWVGTMIDDIHAPAKFTDGRLFSVMPDGHVSDSGFVFELPNGIDWSPDGRTLYLNDSTAQKTFAFDFSVENGTISRQRVLFDHPAAEGLPDGLCVDSSGTIWSGQWNGWNIKRIAPDGRLIETHKVPVQRPSSVCFFGHNLDRLAFTSAANGMSTADFIAAPDAGSLFELSVRAGGRREHYFGSLAALNPSTVNS